MPARTATARWEGGLREGNGNLHLGSGAYDGQYSFTSRFEEGTGTNPEELVGAALAGCFSMALSAALERAEYEVTSVETTAKVHLDKSDAGFAISRIELHCTGVVPGIDEATFLKEADNTKTGCIVSRALAAVDIQLEAQLAS